MRGSKSMTTALIFPVCKGGKMEDLSGWLRHWQKQFQADYTTRPARTQAAVERTGLPQGRLEAHEQAFKTKWHFL